MDQVQWSINPFVSERAARAIRRAAAAAEDANPAAAATSLVTSQDLHILSLIPSLSQGILGEATRLWAQYRFGEWVKSAELVMIIVPESVEDELVFSTLEYICNPSTTGYTHST